FIFLFIVSGIVSMKKDNVAAIESNSLLELTFDNPIIERTSKNPLEGLRFPSLRSEQDLGLNDILKNIEKAKTDDRIRGIFLNLSSLQAGISTVEEIRDALLDFKNSKKFIYAYCEYYTQGTYYLASVADKLYMNPQGY